MQLQTNWRPVLAAALFVLVGGTFRLWYHHASDRWPLLNIEPGHMPACDSPPTRHLLRQTLEQAPELKKAGFAVLKLGAFGDRNPPGTPSAPDSRDCVGEIYSNLGHDRVGFTLTWISPRKDELYLEVTDLPF